VTRHRCDHQLFGGSPIRGARWRPSRSGGEIRIHGTGGNTRDPSSSNTSLVLAFTPLIDRAIAGKCIRHLAAVQATVWVLPAPRLLTTFAAALPQTTGGSARHADGTLQRRGKSAPANASRRIIRIDISWRGLTAARRLGRVLRRDDVVQGDAAALRPDMWICQPQSGPAGAAHERSAGARRPR
jgi:hypothetical protein